MNADLHTIDFRRWVGVPVPWNRDRERATYPGQALPHEVALLVAPDEMTLTRGRLSATLRLPPDASQSQARIVLGRNPDSRDSISAGVGGHNAHYVIEVWEEQHHMQRPLAVMGSATDPWAPEL